MRSSEQTIKVNNEEMTVYRIDSDYYGNPRYVIHFLSLGLKDYESSKLTRKAGLKVYRGKWFGGGFVMQSYSIERDIERVLEILKGGE